MPAASASPAVVGVSAMTKHSHIAIMFASPENRKTRNVRSGLKSYNANMEDDDKNGGPNNLRAWMRFRKKTGAALAEELGGNVTPGMISDLANSKRQLSAKWLRRLAAALDTTPGHLLDHDPADIPDDILDVWVTATPDQQRQIAALARVVVDTPVKTGTTS